jgi:anti-anti-sigma regulatory factor
MLRITRQEEPPARATLRLEGSVAAEWAALLEHECLDLLRICGVVRLDLAGVGFVDRAGVETLGRLGRSGVDIRCRPGVVASVLEAEGVRVALETDGADDA